MASSNITDQPEIPKDDGHELVNSDLLRLIPRNACSLLEIGCGTGALGQAFLGMVPNAFYAGIEIIPESAQIARQRLSRVFEVNAENYAPCDHAITDLDCLIFDNSLELLQDPWTTLATYAALLKECGTIVACIQNTQHWKILAGLFLGQWRYNGQGLIDRNHLRFFTFESICELFTSIGFQYLEITPRGTHLDEHARFCDTVKPMLDPLGINENNFRTQTAALQYLIRAQRQTPRHRLVQALTRKPVGGCNDVRINQPLTDLASLPGLIVRCEIDIATFGKHIETDDKIFIWQRPLIRASDLVKIDKLVDKGYVVVLEFDDHPMHFPKISENGNLTFTAFHAIQTSTEFLANLFRQLNPEVAVFENTISTLPAFPENKFAGERKRKLKIFFGALNRENDWRPYINEINSWCQEADDRFEWVIIHDRIIFDDLKTSCKRFTPTCDYATYLQILQKCDLAWLPLTDAPINRGKSDLKFIECAAQGVVVLASPVVYMNTIKPDITGVIVNSGADLIKQLDALYFDKAKRKAIAKNAWDYVRKHRMSSTQVLARTSWYAELISRRDALERERLKRLKNSPK